MDFLEVLLSAVLVWIALRIETKYRRWAVRDHLDALGGSRPQRPLGPLPNPLTPAPPPPPPRPVTFNRHALPVMSTVMGAATTVMCYCHHRSENYVELIDGTRECMTCWMDRIKEVKEAEEARDKKEAL